ncbi:hypothetical protein [Microlunatus speluncae]|uniref:hypothetical protein n=1 Tax=Microlunatus speluncae TaxID=2594267 RepID=UPI0012663F82|nr:hypothetical protein [Microlunatus speluncae]
MADPEAVPLLTRPWPTLNHRVVRTELERLGWKLFAQGDWAYVLRSPSGRLVGRVSPFEPGYGYFIDLCRRCAGHRHLPRVELATPLEGGGHLAVLEHLEPPASDAVRDFLHQWEHPEQQNEDLRSLRLEVDRIDEWGRRKVRGWIGVDLGDRHVLRSADGSLKVIDLFGVDWGFLDHLVEDPPGFARAVDLDQCRYLLDLPDLQLDDHPAGYLARIRTAFEIAFPSAATSE